MFAAAPTTFHQPSTSEQTGQQSTAVRRQAEVMALQAIDALRQVAPEIAPVFEQGGARALIVEQYEAILESGEVRWEGRL